MAGGNAILVNRTTQTVGGVMTLTGLPQTANTSTALNPSGKGPLMIFDATYQVFGTIASTSAVNVQYTLNPNWTTDLAAGVTGVFVTVTTLTTTIPTLVTMHAYAIRLVNSSTSSNDNYGIAWAWADKR